ncbi:hypothetical protein FNV43_RR04344 [Rhamnella rubrinervis]|uniref:Uncharacterized protein n=1 Tax=Rhamnella rubrinervis TaxID=2594499 RepID=A0A8K0HKU8_9ROSA|nr:hypothetical protein FNV43_RR04344 [Rhamnella rubrinervis]
MLRWKCGSRIVSGLLRVRAVWWLRSGCELVLPSASHYHGFELDAFAFGSPLQVSYAGVQAVDLNRCHWACAATELGSRVDLAYGLGTAGQRSWARGANRFDFKFMESLVQGYQLSLDDNVEGGDAIGGIAQVSDSGKAMAGPTQDFPKQHTFAAILDGASSSPSGPKDSSQPFFAAVVIENSISPIEKSDNQYIPTRKGNFISILFDLARGIEVPLRIDNATLSGNFCQFARVLINIDLGQSSSHQVENSTEDQQTVAVTIGIDILGTKVTTSVVVDSEILPMDLDAAALVQKITGGKSVQNVSSV